MATNDKQAWPASAIRGAAARAQARQAARDRAEMSSRRDWFAGQALAGLVQAAAFATELVAGIENEDGDFPFDAAGKAAPE